MNRKLEQYIRELYGDPCSIDAITFADGWNDAAMGKSGNDNPFNGSPRPNQSVEAFRLMREQWEFGWQAYHSANTINQITCDRCGEIRKIYWDEGHWEYLCSECGAIANGAGDGAESEG